MSRIYVEDKTQTYSLMNEAMPLYIEKMADADIFMNIILFLIFIIVIKCYVITSFFK